MWAARAMVRACDAIICQSQQAADALALLFPLSAQKTIVISNWIDTGPFQQLEDAEPAVDSEGPALLFMGHLESYKGPDTLLAAAALLRQRGVAFRLIFCGDGSQHGELLSKSQEFEIADAVQWRGWVHGQAKQQVFREADLFVLPSRDREGVPNVLLEAMAAGLPLVTTAVSGIPSIVADGVNAVVIPPADAPALASAIEQILADPHRRRAMSRINRQAALAHDVERVWPRLAEAIFGRPVEREGS
jgi:glycosyltransferase involved in cell wall biosynthesis